MLKVRHRFLPIRLVADEDNSVDLIVEVENSSDEEPLVSVVLVVPKDSPLSFDELGVHKLKKIRLGKIPPYSVKDFSVPIYVKKGVNPGLYKLGLIVYIHGGSYGEILDEIKELCHVRVV